MPDATRQELATLAAELIQKRSDVPSSLLQDWDKMSPRDRRALIDGLDAMRPPSPLGERIAALLVFYIDS